MGMTARWAQRKARLESFEIEQKSEVQGECDLCELAGSTPGRATHRVRFEATGLTVELCDRHAIPLIGLAAWLETV